MRIKNYYNEKLLQNKSNNYKWNLSTNMPSVINFVPDNEKLKNDNVSHNFGESKYYFKKPLWSLVLNKADTNTDKSRVRIRKITNNSTGQKQKKAVIFGGSLENKNTKNTTKKSWPKYNGHILSRSQGRISDTLSKSSN